MRRVLVRFGWFGSSAGAQIVAAVLGFVTNVIYAQTLSLGAVGTIALVTAAAMVLAVFLDRGLGTWVTRNGASGIISGRAALMLLLRAGAPGLVALFATMAGTAVLLLSGTQEFLNIDVSVILLITLLTVSFFMFQTALSYAQALNAPHARASTIVVNAAITLALSSAVAISIGASTTGYVLASAIAYAFAGLTTMLFLARRSGWNTQTARSDYKTARRQSLPLWGLNVLNYIMGAGDVIILGALASTQSVGLYQIAKKVTQSISLPLTAALPIVLGRVSGYSAPDQRRFLTKFLTVGAIFLGMGAVGATLFGDDALGLVFGSQFAAAQPILALQLVGALLLLGREVVGTLLIARGRYNAPLMGQVASTLAFSVALLGVWAHPTALTFTGALAFGYLVGCLTNLAIAIKSR